MPASYAKIVNKAPKWKKLIYKLFYRGKKFSCPFCNRTNNRFLYGGLDNKVIIEKKIIGAGYRANMICPYCESTDRERLVWLTMQNQALIKEGTAILHIAPEQNLNALLKKLPIKYYTADKESPLAEEKMDITKIKYPENFFDGIICNHVLEHIIDDKKAISELNRVLKVNGWAILQVPFSPILDVTFEDEQVISNIDRFNTFGQDDHVRIYGKDYPQRLITAGFTVKKLKLSRKLIDKYALNPNEMVFLCKKSSYI